jgi:hypothetical protein
MVEAVAFCGRCGNGICAVCKFDEPAGVRCPHCMGAAAPEAPRGSTKGAIASLALAVMSALCLIGFFGTAVVWADDPELEAALGLLFLVPFGGTIAGLALGFVAKDEARRQGSVVAMLGVASNGILLAGLMVLVLIGSCAE